MHLKFKYLHKTKTSLAKNKTSRQKKKEDGKTGAETLPEQDE